MNPNTAWEEKIARNFFMSVVIADLVEHSTTDYCEIESMNLITAWEGKIAKHLLCQQW